MVLDILYERMELSYIYVDSRKRHQGIASLLMDFMLKEALNNQVEVISLEVSKENKAAIALYEKYGFQIAAKREGYYQGIDALLMTKDVK
jgi:ribosomal-protein-alanine N-acetyltransferase